MAYSKSDFLVISGQFANDFIYTSEKVTSKIHWTTDHKWQNFLFKINHISMG